MYSSWWLTSNRLVASCSTMGILVPAWYLGSLSLGGQIGTGSLTSAWWLSLAEDVVTKAMAPAIIKPNQAILWREDMLSLRSGTWLRVQGVKLDTWHGCSLKPYHFIVSLHVWWVMQVMQRLFDAKATKVLCMSQSGLVASLKNFAKRHKDVS